MEWNDILKFFNNPATISILIGGLWSILFNRIKEGQKAEFQQQIEILKTKNEKTNYITKTQFDAEFEMYQELSKKILLVIKQIKKFDQSKTISHIKYVKIASRLMDGVKTKIEELEISLFQYAPFIKKDIYDLMNDFYNLVSNKFIFIDIGGILEGHATMPKVGRIAENFDTETKEIFILYEQIIDKLRDYLQSLKVIED